MAKKLNIKKPNVKIPKVKGIGPIKDGSAYAANIAKAKKAEAAANKAKRKKAGELLQTLGSSISEIATANAPYQSTPQGDQGGDATATGVSGASNGAKYIDAFHSNTSFNGNVNDNEE